ncbi:unnamed protein product [Jaminaea pallidilutea]
MWDALVYFSPSTHFTVQPSSLNILLFIVSISSSLLPHRTANRRGAAACRPSAVSAELSGRRVPKSNKQRLQSSHRTLLSPQILVAFDTIHVLINLSLASMSFNDLERGSTGSPRPNRPKANTPLPLYHAPGGSSRISPHDDDDDNDSSDNRQRHSALSDDDKTQLKRLSDGVGAQIFKINSNTAAIQKLIKLAETPRPSSHSGSSSDRDWTKRAHELVESTRSVVKVTTPQLKQLSDLILSLGDSCPPQYKLTLSKLQRDFEEALQTFAMAQKQSARKSKEELEGAKRAVQRGAAAAGGQSRSLLIDEEEQGRDGGAQEGDFDGQQQQQQQQQQGQQLATSQAGPSLAELEFQETLIAEREVEIREIESGIHELNEIFRDLGAIVQEQGGMIDNIEYNIGEIATNTEGADRELVTAQEYQRKAGKRAACLLLIVGFVISVVLLAILS